MNTTMRNLTVVVGLGQVLGKFMFASTRVPFLTR